MPEATTFWALISREPGGRKLFRFSDHPFSLPVVSTHWLCEWVVSTGRQITQINSINQSLWNHLPNTRIIWQYSHYRMDDPSHADHPFGIWSCAWQSTCTHIAHILYDCGRLRLTREMLSPETINFQLIVKRYSAVLTLLLYHIWHSVPRVGQWCNSATHCIMP